MAYRGAIGIMDTKINTRRIAKEWLIFLVTGLTAFVLVILARIVLHVYLELVAFIMLSYLLVPAVRATMWSLRTLRHKPASKIERVMIVAIRLWHCATFPQTII